MYNYDKATGKFWWASAGQGRQLGIPAGSINSEGYVCLMYEGKKVQAHRLAWFMTYGYWPGIIDHINRNRADNRITNLREVTAKENARNSSAHCDKVSGLPRCVDFTREGNYRVRVRVGGKRYSRQGFYTVEDAVAWRDLMLSRDE